ncbi:hypothetical protein Q8F55_006826 [Vanrija albida]|uniref:WW domain-containing protein n=1 Tax=Vanrija albida TaxID=181172 RepID=A0ABR3PY66_9TREE
MPPSEPDGYAVRRDQLLSHGVSPRGAKWERFRDDAGAEVYRYVNRDKSYAYHFPGGWSYVHDGAGFAEWRTPEGETYTFYGASLARSHPYLGQAARRTMLPPPHRDVALDIPPVPSKHRKHPAKSYARAYAISQPQRAEPPAESSRAAGKRKRAPILTPPTSPDSPRALRRRRGPQGSPPAYFDEWSVGSGGDSDSEPEWVASGSSEDGVARRLDFLSSGPSRRRQDTPPRKRQLIPVVEIVTPRKRRPEPRDATPKRRPEATRRDDTPYGLHTPRSPRRSGRHPARHTYVDESDDEYEPPGRPTARRSVRTTVRRAYAEEESDDGVWYLGAEDADEVAVDQVLAV